MSSIDVVVPCYNYGRFLPACVKSILSQEGVDVRVLIIDDASVDDTTQVAQQLAMLDGRVEFRRHESNKGKVATFNEGIFNWSSSKYTLILSADDLLTPGSLRRALQFMDQHNDVGMVYGRAMVITGDLFDPLPIATVSEKSQVISGSRLIQSCCQNLYNPVPSLTAVVRTELQYELGGYLEQFAYDEDMEMWLRFAARSRIGVLRAVQGYYRWHSQNLSSRYQSQAPGDRREFAAAFEYIISTLVAEFPESGRWLNTMYERLADQALGYASADFNRSDETSWRAWLQFAEEVYPRLSRRSIWWRFLAKRLLTPPVWHKLRPTWHHLRGISGDYSATLFRPQRGQEIGWWPELS